MPDGRDSQRARRLRERDGVPDLEVAALGYDGAEDHAPKVIAHGRGHTARRILELAEQHDLPVTKDPTLVSILGALDVGAEIPPDLYGVIAEVLAWAYHADKAAGDTRAEAARRAA
ncbi:MAG: putative flhb domain protein [Thermoleophilia bacterium]|nr:putative flhb domain protein [Thermoleophilia bacterium]